jgi:putative DNA primase/helicase
MSTVSDNAPNFKIGQIVEHRPLGKVKSCGQGPIIGIEGALYVVKFPGGERRFPAFVLIDPNKPPPPPEPPKQERQTGNGDGRADDDLDPGEPQPNGHGGDGATEHWDINRIRVGHGESVDHFSDEGLALRYAVEHENDLRFVAAWGKWYKYDGACWRAETTLWAFDQARKLCRRAAFECGDAKLAKALSKGERRAAIVSLAKSDRLVAATPDQWDADPWLLNTPGGVVDLRTGKMRRHRAKDYHSQMTAVKPDPACPIPLWLGLIDIVTGKNAELIAFMKRLIGYWLTGITREHNVSFWWGSGGNGKTTIIEAIARIMGNYHEVGYIETFTEVDGKAHRGHPTDVAKLHRARLVTVTETEEGRYWSMSMIKAMTGGDKMTGRFMRQDFFDFVPMFKPVISGNHKPKLRSVDDATRRRFNLIAFEHKIENADKTFPEKLKAEWPGILAWAIDGCLDWQRESGLNPPASVIDATAEYLEEEDDHGAWIAERLDLMKDATELTAALYRDWKQWAEGRGIHPGTQSKLTRKLKDNHGFQKVGKDKAGQQLGGYTFKPEVQAEHTKQQEDGDWTKKHERNQDEKKWNPPF